MPYEGEMKELDDNAFYDQMNEFISTNAKQIDREMDELVEMEENLSRQTDMREIFLTYDISFSSVSFHFFTTLLHLNLNFNLCPFH